MTKNITTPVSTILMSASPYLTTTPSSVRNVSPCHARANRTMKGHERVEAAQDGTSVPCVKCMNYADCNSLTDIRNGKIMVAAPNRNARRAYRSHRSRAFCFATCLYRSVAQQIGLRLRPCQSCQPQPVAHLSTLSRRRLIAGRASSYRWSIDRMFYGRDVR